jgi:hypothetical protein
MSNGSLRVAVEGRSCITPKNPLDDSGRGPGGCLIKHILWCSDN